MSFTDIFIRRPVLAIVISLVILVLGLKAATTMSVRQYPLTQNAVVTISTAYPGASPDTIAGFITTPIEKAVAQASGIDYMTSSSSLGFSTIYANLRLNQDTSKSLAEIITQVNSVRNQMPAESQASVISLSVGETFGSVMIAFTSKDLPANKISDYLIRVVQPQIQAVEGVQQASIMGEKRFAVRVWLKPEKLAAYGLSASDVSSVLVANNYLSALGQTKGQMVQLNLLASTNMQSIDEFKKLIIRESNGGYVRLNDVADIELGAENYSSRVMYDGKFAVLISVQVAPSANVLDVANRVRALLPQIQAQLPQGLKADVAYDASKYINNSIQEVESTLLQSILIVVLVIFAFLGSPRAVFIPVITIPLSLIGTGIFMLMYQHPHLARAGACHRSRGGRRDHRGRKRQPPSGGGQNADGCGDPGRPRTCQPHHRHDAGLDRRVCADRLHGWSHRRAVHRIRLHLGGCGGDLGDQRLDPVADAGEPHVALPPRHQIGLGTAHRHLYRREIRLAAHPLPAHAACDFERTRRRGGVRRHRSEQHLRPIHLCQE
jgi:hypothetical protein